MWAAYLIDCRRVCVAQAESEEDARGVAGSLSDENPGVPVAIFDGAVGNVVDVYRDNKALGVTELPGDW